VTTTTTTTAKQHIPEQLNSTFATKKLGEHSSSGATTITGAGSASVACETGRGDDLMTIKTDENNYRIHSTQNKTLIRNSLKDFGAGRSILIDSSDTVIAGNGTFEQARELGIPIKVIETDGTELIAVKRKDISPDDYRRKRLAVMDNSTTDTSKFDFELLSSSFSLDELPALGVDLLPNSTFDDICTDALPVYNTNQYGTTRLPISKTLIIVFETSDDKANWIEEHGYNLSVKTKLCRKDFTEIRDE